MSTCSGAAFRSLGRPDDESESLLLFVVITSPPIVRPSTYAWRCVLVLVPAWTCDQKATSTAWCRRCRSSVRKLARDRRSLKGDGSNLNKGVLQEGHGACHRGDRVAASSTACSSSVGSGLVGALIMLTRLSAILAVTFASGNFSPSIEMRPSRGIISHARHLT
jgi:hypothetical protein